MTGFRKAKRRQVWIRAFLLGQSKNGKSYTGLTTSLHLADLMGLPPETVGVIDTEIDDGDLNDQQGSVEKYEGENCQCRECMGSGMVLTDFKTMLLPPGQHEPTHYLKAISAARAEGFKVLLIDSLSHEWQACLNMVDRARGSKFAQGWGQVTPLHDQVISAIKSYPGHVIVTMRAKEKHEQVVGDDGRKQVRSLGILPVQRPQIEYEFDFGVFMENARGVIVGARSASLNGRPYERPGRQLAQDLLDWSLRGEQALRERVEGDARRAQAVALERDIREVYDEIRGLAARGGQQLQQQVEGMLQRVGVEREKLGKLLEWVQDKVRAPEQRPGAAAQHGARQAQQQARQPHDQPHGARGQQQRSRAQQGVPQQAPPQQQRVGQRSDPTAQPAHSGRASSTSQSSTTERQQSSTPTGQAPSTTSPSGYAATPPGGFLAPNGGPGGEPAFDGPGGYPAGFPAHADGYTDTGSGADIPFPPGHEERPYGSNNPDGLYPPELLPDPVAQHSNAQAHSLDPNAGHGAGDGFGGSDFDGFDDPV